MRFVACKVNEKNRHRQRNGEQNAVPSVAIVAILLCPVIPSAYVETMYYIVSLSSSSTIVCRDDVIHRLYKRVTIHDKTDSRTPVSHQKYTEGNLGVIMPQNKRVLITLQSGANHCVISTFLQCNQHPFAE